MKRIIASLLLLGALMASTVGTAFAGNPHEAGQSGNWKGSATPCKAGAQNDFCPPHG